MAKSNQDHFNKQLRTDTGDLAVHVAEFTRHLSGLAITAPKPGRFRAPDKVLAMLNTAGRKPNYVE